MGSALVGEEAVPGATETVAGPSDTMFGAENEFRTNVAAFSTDPVPLAGKACDWRTKDAEDGVAANEEAALGLSGGKASDWLGPFSISAKEMDKQEFGFREAPASRGNGRAEPAPVPDGNTAPWTEPGWAAGSGF